MKHIFFFLCALVSTFFSGAQENQGAGQSEAISDCFGAITILQPGNYSLQFTGKGGTVKDFEAYSSLSDIPEKNALWCSFKAPSNGRLSFSADVAEGPLQVILFENETKEICDDILKGKANARRVISSKDHHAGLDLVTAENVLYPLELIAGKHVMICFIGIAKERPKLELHLKFEPVNGGFKPVGPDSKTVDLRTVKDDPAVNIMVRDVETGNPVVANVTLSGLKNMDALYNGSDLYIMAEKSGKIKIKVDAEGYFFVDREEPISAGSENEIVVWLEPLGEGKSIQIEGIEFMPGSSEFLSTSGPKLRRLVDFLALNAAVEIEIQGHVHANGENSFAGQKLSEARAKRVMNYLIENGIHKDRLTAVGYGNTMPIYKNPKFAYEEQANRRVEIKIR